ncbi:hypothetical protein [Alteromonas phage ZP6]|uniref:Uncharacterized protein n=1 Tax=Alteromonas phage ZP6 TaxID=2492447 RepID=A0A3S9U884_9CAUD|nr:hypothetical protein PQC03_gp31 [Alteromonas phage ZP6]AZS06534.1 hypothetical protein [Alteromonas phage ZP6]
MNELPVTLFEFSRSNQAIHRGQDRISVHAAELKPVFDTSLNYMSPVNMADVEYWPILTLKRAVRANDENEDWLKRRFPDLVWTQCGRDESFGSVTVMYETRIAIDYNFYKLIDLHIGGTLDSERSSMRSQIAAATEREKKWESRYKALDNLVIAFETQPWYIRIWAALKGDIREL